MLAAFPNGQLLDFLSAKEMIQKPTAAIKAKMRTITADPNLDGGGPNGSPSSANFEPAGSIIAKTPSPAPANPAAATASPDNIYIKFFSFESLNSYSFPSIARARAKSTSVTPPRS